MTLDSLDLLYMGVGLLVLLPFVLTLWAFTLLGDPQLRHDARVRLHDDNPNPNKEQL